MAATDSRPIPIKNTAYRVIFPILDADGDLVTGAATLDSEVSKDSGTFADCTNEATEIATSSGMYYLDLTSTEMNADAVAVIVKTGTAGAKTTPIVLYPNETGDIDVDVTAYGGTAGTFASGIPSVNAAQVSGDATAADNLEAALDGTGGVTITAAVTGNITGNLSGSVGSVTGAVGGNVTGSVGSLAAQAKADVNAEVVDALVTDTYAEVSGVPAATSSLKDKINWLFALARNKVTQTSTTQTLRNDADNASLATAAVSDDGTTATRAEWA